MTALDSGFESDHDKLGLLAQPNGPADSTGGGGARAPRTEPWSLLAKARATWEARVEILASQPLGLELGLPVLGVTRIDTIDRLGIVQLTSTKLNMPAPWAPRGRHGGFWL